MIMLYLARLRWSSPPIDEYGGMVIGRGISKEVGEEN
jgi:hypothetical protein